MDDPMTWMIRYQMQGWRRDAERPVPDLRPRIRC